MTNKEVITKYVKDLYGPINILNYEEGAKRCYMRFLSNEGMHIAEKTKAAGTQIIIYKMEWSIKDYD